MKPIEAKEKRWFYCKYTSYKHQLCKFGKKPKHNQQWQINKKLLKKEISLNCLSTKEKKLWGNKKKIKLDTLQKMCLFKDISYTLIIMSVCEGKSNYFHGFCLREHIFSFFTNRNVCIWHFICVFLFFLNLFYHQY